MKNYIKLLVSLCMCVVLSDRVFAEAKVVQAALNPEFVKYMESPSGGAMTDSGHALGYLPSPVSHPSYYLSSQGNSGGSSYPSSYDLRTTGKLTAVKNQYSCGACWSFATMGAMESFLKTSETWDFSENNLKNTAGFIWGPCAGGNYDMSIAYLSRWSGPVNETDDPYGTGTTSTSPSGLTVQKHVQGAYYLPDRSSYTDNDTIKWAIQTYGAVQMSMYWVDSSFNSTYNSYYFSGSQSINHAIALVGWDDNYSASKFSSTPAGNGAFIVRNSWGSSWGDAGYFYISYYDRSAMKYLMVFDSVGATTNYSSVYSYDPLGQTSGLGYGTTSVWLANVFTSLTAQHSVSAVGFYTRDANTSYAVYIDTGVSSTPNGYTASYSSGTIAMPGYHTVQVPTVVLSGGQKFSVKLKLGISSGSLYGAVEMPVSGYAAPTASSGQSYISSDGSSWEDITTDYANTNVCIKAYASSDTTAPSQVAWVYDGTGSDIQYTTSTTTLSANWAASTDSESGIAAYWYAIGTTAGGTDVVGWTSNGTSQSVTKTGLSLSYGQKYYFSVKAQNGAGLYSTPTNSDGITVTESLSYTLAFSANPVSAGALTITAQSSVAMTALTVSVTQAGASQTAVTMSPDSAATTWTGTYTVVSGYDGTAVVRSTATINGSTSSITRNIVVDTAGPTAAVTLDSGASSAYPGAHSVSVSVSDLTGLSAVPTLGVKWRGASSPVSIPLTLGGSSYTGTFNVESYTSSGTATFVFSGSDAAGNTGTSITSGATFTAATSLNGTAGGTTSNTDGSSVIIFPNSYSGSLVVPIEALPADDSAMIAANAKAAADNLSVITSTQLVREISPYDASTGLPVTALSGSATLSIPYPDSDSDGIVDGTTIKASSLKLYYLNQSTLGWEQCAGSVVYTSSHTVSAPISHFSTYGVLSALSYSGGTGAIIVYPNPCYFDKDSAVKFANIPLSAPDVKIRIYTVSGQLVRTLEIGSGISSGSSFNLGQWDGKNSSGEHVASGLYLYLIKGNGVSKKGKIAVLW